MTIKHGYFGTRLYNIWRSMKKRCDNPKDNFYHRYGGRGINYDPTWANAATFISWALANGYADHLELDRMDNDGHYTPANCRFITHRENMANRVNTMVIELDGIQAPICDHADRCGLSRTTVYSRIKKGIEPRKAFYATKRKTANEALYHSRRSGDHSVSAQPTDSQRAACRVREPDAR